MSFSIVIFPAEPEVGGYVGACVEKHLVVQADTIEEIPTHMESILASHAWLDAQDGRELFAMVPDAPQKFRKAFMKSERALDFKCLEYTFEVANDTAISEKANAVRGPRYYRYTDERPPQEDVWWFM